METIFCASEFVTKCVDLAKNHKTVYALGMWGWKLTREAINTKARQLPDFYTEAEKKKLYALADEGGYWGFDCVCLIKALLWGWGTDLDNKRGGAKYGSNGVPDFGADGILKYCTDVSADFDEIEGAEIVWMPGHVGVYIGGGLVVECTRRWDAKVLISALGNIGKVAGFPTRTWNKHGRLKWIDYEDSMTPAEKKEFDELKARVDEQGDELDALKKQVEEQSVPLTVYHWWEQIKEELPWAYKPLWAMYEAGYFKGESAADLNVCRVKIECEVSLAAALKQMGIIDY